MQHVYIRSVMMPSTRKNMAPVKIYTWSHQGLLNNYTLPCQIHELVGFLYLLVYLCTCLSLICVSIPDQTNNDRDLNSVHNFPIAYIKTVFFFSNKKTEDRKLKKPTCQVNFHISSRCLPRHFNFFY